VSASRAFRLKEGEPVPSGIRRIARGRIDHALDELNGKSDSSPEESVHEARKDMKKLRALLRLVRGEIGEKAYRRENDTFRDAARELAGVRDADVMLATLGALEKRYPEEFPAGAAGGLRQALEAHRLRTSAGARGPASEAAIQMLREARSRVSGWPLERDGIDAFADGLKLTYRRGRRDWRAADKEPSNEHLHEWRKRVKDLWYHSSLLQESWEPVMKALADEAHELSDRLGDDHDLAVLLDWANAHADGAELEAAVAKRRQDLQADAFSYGARLYADKPGVYAERIERWWEASARAARAEPAHN
jgi:CHAD domain-containing protein